jgi:hypothetical protein
VGAPISECQLTILDCELGKSHQLAIGNLQSAIVRPTRYRGVVLTSWDRTGRNPQELELHNFTMKNEKWKMENGK